MSTSIIDRSTNAIGDHVSARSICLGLRLSRAFMTASERQTGPNEEINSPTQLAVEIRDGLVPPSPYTLGGRGTACAAGWTPSGAMEMSSDSCLLIRGCNDRLMRWRHTKTNEVDCRTAARHYANFDERKIVEHDTCLVIYIQTIVYTDRLETCVIYSAEEIDCG